MSIKRQIENASKEISNWPDWKKEAFGIKSMTDNPIKEALEEAIEEYMGALRGKLQKAYREQIGLKLEKAEAALALIDKVEVMYCAFEFSYNGLCPDKDSAQDVLDAFGEKELSPIPVLVIPLEQEQ